MEFRIRIKFKLCLLMHMMHWQVPIIRERPRTTGRDQPASTSNLDERAFYLLALCRRMTYLTNSTTWLMSVVSHVILSRFFLAAHLTDYYCVMFLNVAFCVISVQLSLICIVVCMYVWLLCGTVWGNCVETPSMSSPGDEIPEVTWHISSYLFTYLPLNYK